MDRSTISVPVGCMPAPTMDVRLTADCGGTSSVVKPGGGPAIATAQRRSARDPSPSSERTEHSGIRFEDRGNLFEVRNLL